MTSFRSGFVSFAGRPNVGKSTLFNRILGDKVAIVSEKPQTTRNRILGIKNVEGGQLIFLDTPGLHEGGSALNRQMVRTATASSREADVLLFLIDASAPSFKKDQRMMEIIGETPEATFLVINKIDLVKKETLLPLIAQYQELRPFQQIIPASAITGEGVDLLVTEILKGLPESPAYFPEDMLTDQTERFWVSEIIREKVFEECYQEIPYSTAVTIEEFKEHPEKNLVVIKGTIHVERPAQKKILIGKGGQKLKQIGESARKEAEAFFKTRVFLDLWVSVEKNWTQDIRALGRLGYPSHDPVG